MDGGTVVIGVGAAPIITALVAVIGQALPAMPRRWYPALAVALGIAWNAGVSASLGQLSWGSLLTGIVAGLAASGLYSGVVKPGLGALRDRE